LPFPHGDVDKHAVGLSGEKEEKKEHFGSLQPCPFKKNNRKGKKY
jgi:hypothetical protein